MAAERAGERRRAIWSLHLSWSNRYYLEQVIGGRDIGRNRDAEFAARDGYPEAADCSRPGSTRCASSDEVLNGLDAVSR